MSPLASRSASARRIRRRLMLASAAAAALACSATPAHAQFGKLIKKAAQNVAQGAADAATPGGASSANNRGERTVEISAQSIDALFLALGPSVRAANAYTAAAARYDAQHAQYEAFDKCRDDIKRTHKTGVVPSQAELQAQGNAAIRVSELMQRLAVAQQAGDTATAYTVLDSTAIIGEQMENAMLPQLKTCGAHVAQPRGSRPRAADIAAPTVPAGMTATQFGRLRERVAAWLLTDGTYKVDPAEQAALEARRSDLATLTPLFRGNALAWANWSDLSAK